MKFNNSLLKVRDHIKIVKDTIQEVKTTYIKIDNEQPGNSISDKKVKFNITDPLFLETLLTIFT